MCGMNQTNNINTKDMKVTIQTIQFYHKVAEVEIDVCNDDYEDYLINNKYGNLQDYLSERDHLYTDNIDEAISKADYMSGDGKHLIEDDVWSESSIWRYDCKELNTGGHL